ncbi:MAG: hypothetical protein HLUCCO18_10225 [Rhodobacteraceae bacterium HLUCCO18]|nr:MAG: hypothetical protein HLUCCO18_10225 [Rhodobacteraceae bacterium HLUCCO18]
MRFISAAILFVFIAVAGPLAAQTEDAPVFANYEEMRGTLDDLMSKRRITDLLVAFGGADEMTQQDMFGLETQVRNIFPDDFENSALMMRREMENGFAQDLVAYWTGTAYIYARILWHQRPEGDVLAISMTFNSDPDVLIPLF